MHTVLAYNVTAGVNDANVDMTAAVDPNFSRRNNHYIFSEPYQIIAAAHFAASATRSRFNIPTINGIARHQIFQVNRSLNMPSNPYVADYQDYPIDIPINEEVAVEESNNLGAATEQTNVFLFVAPQGWNRNLGRGLMRLVIRFTATYVVNAEAWSADAAIAFAENLKGGVYEVVGGWAQAAGAMAFRLNFVRAPLYNNVRKLYPGDLCQQAIGDLPSRVADFGWGSWGKFHTFEPPQLNVFAHAAAGTTIEGRLDCIYHGPNAAL